MLAHNFRRTPLHTTGETGVPKTIGLLTLMNERLTLGCHSNGSDARAGMLTARFIACAAAAETPRWPSSGVSGSLSPDEENQDLSRMSWHLDLNHLGLCRLMWAAI